LSTATPSSEGGLDTTSPVLIRLHGRFPAPAHTSVVGCFLGSVLLPLILTLAIFFYVLAYALCRAARTGDLQMVKGSPRVVAAIAREGASSRARPVAVEHTHVRLTRNRASLALPPARGHGRTAR
jgi:hypothetical protein